MSLTTEGNANITQINHLFLLGQFWAQTFKFLGKRSEDESTFRGEWTAVVPKENDPFCILKAKVNLVNVG